MNNFHNTQIPLSVRGVRATSEGITDFWCLLWPAFVNSFPHVTQFNIYFMIPKFTTKRKHLSIKRWLSVVNRRKQEKNIYWLTGTSVGNRLFSRLTCSHTPLSFPGHAPPPLVSHTSVSLISCTYVSFCHAYFWLANSKLGSWGEREMAMVGLRTRAAGGPKNFWRTIFFKLRLLKLQIICYQYMK